MEGVLVCRCMRWWWRLVEERHAGWQGKASRNMLLSQRRRSLLISAVEVEEAEVVS